VDILLAAMEDLLSLGTRVLILGSGHPIYERALQEESRRYQDLLHVHAGYDETLAHLLYAGGDMLLMPSLFEPCGLSQLIASVTERFLLSVPSADSRTPSSTWTAPRRNGFLFSDYTPHEPVAWVERALSHWHDKNVENHRPSRHGTDFSWKALRRDIQALYLRLLGTDGRRILRNNRDRISEKKKSSGASPFRTFTTFPPSWRHPAGRPA
jgi:starch synthase